VSRFPFDHRTGIQDAYPGGRPYLLDLRPNQPGWFLANQEDTTHSPSQSSAILTTRQPAPQRFSQIHRAAEITELELPIGVQVVHYRGQEDRTGQDSAYCYLYIRGHRILG